MIRRQIRGSDQNNEPHLVWNAFIALLSVESYEDLTETQRIAHLIFWYDSEVQNGGHLQYFLNTAGRRANETLDALSQLNLNCQTAVLREAISLVKEQPMSSIETVEEYVVEALESKFGSFDERYYVCVPSAMEALEEYLDANQNEFIEIV